MWKVHKYTSLEELKALEDDWRALHTASVRPDISLSPDWIIPWYKAFGSSLSPHVLGVFKNGVLVLVAPMHASMQSFRLTSLSALQSSANGYSPSGGIVISAEASQTDQLKAMELLSEENNFELYRIYKLPQDEASTFCSLVSESTLFRSGMEAVMSTPMIDLTGDWDHYMSTRSRSHRKDMRRKVKRIEKEPNVELVTGTPQDCADPMLDEVFRISAKSWKKQEGADLQSDVVARNFVHELVQRLGPAGEVKIWLLKIDGVAIAYELHIARGGTLYPIRADYDMDYSCLSPGQILLQMVLKSLFEDPYARLYDSCADDYAYLKSWAHYSTDFYTVDMFSKKLKPSLVYLAKYRVLPTCRRVKQQLSYALAS